MFKRTDNYDNKLFDLIILNLILLTLYGAVTHAH